VGELLGLQVLLQLLVHLLDLGILQAYLLEEHLLLAYHHLPCHPSFGTS
jgi:hypothetical protein